MSKGRASYFADLVRGRTGLGAVVATVAPTAGGMFVETAAKDITPHELEQVAASLLERLTDVCLAPEQTCPGCREVGGRAKAALAQLAARPVLIDGLSQEVH